MSLFSSNVDLANKACGICISTIQQTQHKNTWYSFCTQEENHYIISKQRHSQLSQLRGKNNKLCSLNPANSSKFKPKTVQCTMGYHFF